MLLFYGVSQLISIFYVAPNIASDKRIVDKALSLIDAKPGQKLIDLGCGFGKVLKIARNNYKLKVYGCEISPLPYLISKIQFHNIYYQSATNINLKKYDIIFCYLLPSLIKKIEPLLVYAISQNKKVIAISFGLENLKPAKTIKYLGKTIYIYQ